MLIYVCRQWDIVSQILFGSNFWNNWYAHLWITYFSKYAYLDMHIGMFGNTDYLSDEYFTELRKYFLWPLLIHVLLCWNYFSFSQKFWRLLTCTVSLFHPILHCNLRHIFEVGIIFLMIKFIKAHNGILNTGKNWRYSTWTISQATTWICFLLRNSVLVHVISQVSVTRRQTFAVLRYL